MFNNFLRFIFGIGFCILLIQLIKDFVDHLDHLTKSEKIFWITIFLSYFTMYSIIGGIR